MSVLLEGVEPDSFYPSFLTTEGVHSVNMRISVHMAEVYPDAGPWAVVRGGAASSDWGRMLSLGYREATAAEQAEADAFAESLAVDGLPESWWRP